MDSMYGQCVHVFRLLSILLLSLGEAPVAYYQKSGEFRQFCLSSYMWS